MTKTKTKKVSNSRPARWERACKDAVAAKEALSAALEELEELRSEYESWKDSLPDNLQNGSLADKLSTIVDMDFQSLIDGMDVIDEAESADLPLGFGRD